MKKRELEEALNTALETPTEVFVGSYIQDPQEYIERGRKDLQSNRIEPIRVLVQVGERGKSFGIQEDILDGYALAQSDSTWLIYRPQTKEFHIAWGRDEQHLHASGLFGPDPLAIWLD